MLTLDISKILRPVLGAWQTSWTATIEKSNARIAVSLLLELSTTATNKGAGSFHIHCKIMKELGALAVLGIREQPNLAQNLVTHRH